jgi:Family of unknown function (DUF6545)
MAAGLAVRLICSRCGLWLAYWRLRPLWAAMLQAVPHVELPAERGWRFSIRWRLLRRVIEIRDAELALRPYWRADVAARASAAARSAALSANLQEAVVEAAVVIDAADACIRGIPPSGEPVPERICTTAGDDLHSEVVRLVLVSRAVRRCPIVGELPAGAAGLRFSRRGSRALAPPKAESAPGAGPGGGAAGYERREGLGLAFLWRGIRGTAEDEPDE